MRTAHGLRSGWRTLLVLVIGLAAGPATAIDFSWNLPLPGFFSDPANWTPGAVPGPGDRAIFDVSGAYTVSFVTSPTNNALSVRFGNVTFDIRKPQTYTLTSTSDPSFVVGDKFGETGGLTLIDTGFRCPLPVPCPGTLDGMVGLIGNDPGSTGEVTVGSAVVLDLTELSVGFEGSGSLTISGGAVSSTFGLVGRQPGSDGTVLVTGGGSTWAMERDLHVGDQGTGELTISAGGSVESQRGLIGTSPSSIGTVTVTGSGSAWSMALNLGVGLSGTGELTISAAGSVDVFGSISIASIAGSNGTVTVTGAGSELTGLRLDVGGPGQGSHFGGTGTLDINAGGSVDLTDVMTIDNTGTVTLNGGTINALQVDVNGGSLLGTGVVNATIVNNGGIVSPGLSPGILTLNGDYTQDAAASMVVEIGGVIAGTDYDVVDVLASCVLDGTLDVALINGFTPGPGDSFEVLTCGSLSGEFAMIDGVALGGGLVLQPQYGANSLMLLVEAAAVPALPGGALLLLGGLLATSALWALAKRPGIGPRSRDAR